MIDHAYNVKVIGKGQVLDIALLHDEHIPQRIMQPSVAHASEHLNLRCSM